MYSSQTETTKSRIKDDDLKTIDLNSNDSDNVVNYENTTAHYEHCTDAQDIKVYDFYKTVTPLSIFIQFLYVCLIGLFTFCLLHYYIFIQYENSTNISHSTSSNLLLTEIIMLFCQFCVSYNKLIIKLSKIHKKYPKEVLENILIFNNQTYGAFNTITCCILQISTMALAPMFVPFTKKNCHGYDSKSCGFVQFISFFGIVMIIVYGLLVVVTVLTASFKGNHGIKLLRLNNDIYRKLFDMSIFGVFKIYDDRCVMCCVNTEYGKEHFVKLPCGHKFHNDCVDDWRKRNIKCPICLQTVLLPTNENIV